MLKRFLFALIALGACVAASNGLATKCPAVGSTCALPKGSISNRHPWCCVKGSECRGLSPILGKTPQFGVCANTTSLHKKGEEAEEVEEVEEMEEADVTTDPKSKKKAKTVAKKPTTTKTGTKVETKRGIKKSATAKKAVKNPSRPSRPSPS